MFHSHFFFEKKKLSILSYNHAATLQLRYYMAWQCMCLNACLLCKKQSTIGHDTNVSTKIKLAAHWLVFTMRCVSGIHHPQSSLLIRIWGRIDNKVHFASIPAVSQGTRDTGHRFLVTQGSRREFQPRLVGRLIRSCTCRHSRWQKQVWISIVW